jgi:CrcB protein
MNAAFVGAGGFIGAVCRYSMSGVVQRLFAASTFPYGTLAVNMLGCLLVGLLIGLVESRQLFGPDFRRFVIIGILGGFTTYSTFAFESFALLRDTEYLRAFASFGIHVFLGLALVWLGYGLMARY